jgi:hypothetical protein
MWTACMAPRLIKPNNRISLVSAPSSSYAVGFDVNLAWLDMRYLKEQEYKVTRLLTKAGDGTSTYYNYNRQG